MCHTPTQLPSIVCYKKPDHAYFADVIESRQSCLRTSCLDLSMFEMKNFVVLVVLLAHVSCILNSPIRRQGGGGKKDMMNWVRRKGQVYN